MRKRFRFVIILFIAVFPFSNAVAQDSLAQKIQDKIDSTYKNTSLDSLKKNFHHRTDSLQGVYDSSMKSLHAEIGKLNYKKDSLTKLNLPTASVTHKIDSVEKAKTQQLNELNSKIENVKKETLSKVSSLHLPADAQNEINSFAKNINGYSMPNNFFKVPSMNLQVPGMPSLPPINIPSLQKFNLNSPQIPSLSQLQGSLGKDIGQLKNISSQANAKAIEQDVKNIASQNSEMKGMFQQETKVKNMEKELGALKNPKSADSLALAQLKPAINHFAGKEQELQSAMAQVSKYKQKYSSVKSLAELPKRAPNPLRGKPWYERVVPGVNYFIQSKHYMLVDLNPYVGWRFNPHFTAGLGWNERFGVSKGNVLTHRYDHVFGARAYASYLWTHGITFKVAPEVMKAFVPTSSTPDVKHEATVWGLYAGIRKDFSIYKNIKGYSDVMYNFTRQPGKNIYGDPVTFRFGIEVQLKKRVKKEKNPAVDSILHRFGATSLQRTTMLGKWIASVKEKKAEAKQYTDFLKKNFTKPEIRHIKNKTAFTGMSEKALYQSLGNPIESYVTVVNGATKKQCVFPHGLTVFVVDGKVAAVQKAKVMR